MPSQSRKYRTQWASTFFAAGELVRRGYLVTLTNGNAKFVDLLVQSTNESCFSIDVKGMSAHNWIPVRKPHRENSDQYYILVYVPQQLNDSEIPRYFIMSSREMCQEIANAEEKGMQANKERLANGLEVYKEWASGISFKQAELYENKWATLP